MKQTNAYFLICWMSLARTSLRGFNFAGLGAFFSEISTSTTGDCGMEAACLGFFATFAALRFLRDGRTRVSPDLVVVGFEDVSGLCEGEDEGRDASIGLCTSGVFLSAELLT